METAKQWWRMGRRLLTGRRPDGRKLAKGLLKNKREQGAAARFLFSEPLKDGREAKRLVHIESRFLPQAEQKGGRSPSLSAGCGGGERLADVP